MVTNQMLTNKKPALKLDRGALEQRAREDFRAYAGKILLAGTVTGYNVHGTTDDVHCDPPARVRVFKSTRDEDLCHWCDDWLDPYWDLELVEPHPALAGYESLWTFGPSYRTNGERNPTFDWKIENTTILQRIGDWLRARYPAKENTKQ